MTDYVLYDKANMAHRWLGYFDLLGVRSMIETGNHYKVFDVYARAIERAESNRKRVPAVKYICFSDTFVIYSKSDSGEDYAYIDSVARWFVFFLLEADIPVRGALSCGEYYADARRSLFYGSALVEAYEYGEAQDWVGFILAPSAVAQLGKLGLSVGQRLNYAYWRIPFKKSPMHERVLELPACILGQWITMNRKNPCLEALKRMKTRVSDQHHAKKYDNAIGFIEEKHRNFRGDVSL